MSSLIPSITNAFLQTILKDYFKSDVEVTNFEIPKSFGTGHSYCSDLIRINVSYLRDGRDAREISMVAKMEHTNEEVSNILSDYNCFRNEVEIYNNVLSVIRNYDKEKKLSPDAIYTSLTPKPTLFLEDMSVFGFRSLKQLELPLDHILLVLQKLAILHAGSVAIYERDPKLVAKYDMPLHCDHPSTTSILKTTFATMKAACERIPELQKYTKKMSLEKIFKKLHSSIKPTGKFNVLNHGDAWTSNFMYRYDENGNVEDMVLVDFQLPAFAGPGLDLQYFWVTCTSVDMKESSIDIILEHYWKELKNKLQKMQVKTKIPTLEEVREDFNAKSATGFATMITTLPIFLGNKTPDFTIDEFYNKEDPRGFRRDFFNNKKYIDHVKVILAIYDKLGFFD